MRQLLVETKHLLDPLSMLGTKMALVAFQQKKDISVHCRQIGHKLQADTCILSLLNRTAAQARAQTPGHFSIRGTTMWTRGPSFSLLSGSV